MLGNKKCEANLLDSNFIERVEAVLHGIAANNSRLVWLYSDLIAKLVQPIAGDSTLTE